MCAAVTSAGASDMFDSVCVIEIISSQQLQSRLIHLVCFKGVQLSLLIPVYVCVFVSGMHAFGSCKSHGGQSVC